MVVCKCRKATKLYCFVHKVPVCGECICFPEHQICVVNTYSEWVIDGEYDWPPKCCMCQVAIEEKSDSQTIRLGCLHVTHTNCFASHIKGFPPHTAPAGYICPACSTVLWPPKTIKDSGSLLHSKLKEAILKTGLEKNLFGSHPVSIPIESHGPPPFESDPHISAAVGYNINSSPSLAKDPTNLAEGYSNKHPVIDIVEIDGPNPAENPSAFNHESNFRQGASPSGPGATTRKTGFHADRQNSEISYYADDEDGNQKKYSRRGPLRYKFLRALLPFWSSALPILPVTAPSKKDTSNALDDIPEGRSRHQKSSRMDPRKILLVIAIMACMATMGILYYRLVQRGFGEDLPGEEQP